MTTLLISDLHLCQQRPRVTQAFIRFLESLGPDIEALYILGDFFEYWIGDEATGDEQYASVISALRKTTDRGLSIYFMHGNRDFLVGEEFLQKAGCKLLPDPTVITIGDKKVLITHGDSLCTDDTEHMEFSKIVRATGWQNEFLSKSIPERIKIAQQYRELSQESTAAKPAEIMDVNQNEVERVMAKNETQNLIHGHTHRPKVHQFKLGEQTAYRYVLGAWYEQGSVLRCDEKIWRLETLTY